MGEWTKRIIKTEEIYIYAHFLLSQSMQEWNKSQHLQALSDAQQVYNMTAGLDHGDPDGLFDAADMLSPGGHTDAQTLAMMLQEQLDAINNEIRYVWAFHSDWNWFLVKFSWK